MTGETKTWMTPARIARGPEAANEELRRWQRARPPAIKHRVSFDSVAQMRADKRAAQFIGAGSRATPVEKRIDLIDVGLIAAALTGGYLFWRSFKNSARVEGATVFNGDVDDSAPSMYSRGLDALSAG
jgi:hypothetical protein